MQKWCCCGVWLKISIFKFGLEKGVFLAKFHFYIKSSMGISGKGVLHFHQETPSLIGYQTNRRTNMFCLINPTLAMSRAMSAFVLWSMPKLAVFLEIFWAVYDVTSWSACNKRSFRVHKTRIYKTVLLSIWNNDLTHLCLMKLPNVVN